MGAKRGASKNKGPEVTVFKNEVGGAELYCKNPGDIPKEIDEHVWELRLDLLRQYPKTFRHSRSEKGRVTFFEEYQGFTIVFSSIFE